MQMYFLYQGRTESWKIDKYLWKNSSRLVFTSYNRDDEKCFKYLWQNFSWLERYQPRMFFFHKYQMLPKKQNLLCRWMNLPTKNLKPGNLDISVVINVINKYRITLSGKQLAGKCGLNACHTEWPYVVDILYWSLVEGLITAGSTFICQKSAVSLLWGHVIWVNFFQRIS